MVIGDGGNSVVCVADDGVILTFLSSNPTTTVVPHVMKRAP
jgi:hypothetical protein